MNEIKINDELVNELGRDLKDVINKIDQGWDECYFSYSTPSEGQQSWQTTHRKDRELNFVSEFLEDIDQDRLTDGIKKLFLEIKEQTGTAPKVGVLSTTIDGQSKLRYDLENASYLDITFNFVGLKRSYFTREEIDPPDFVLEDLKERHKWEKLLEGKPTLEITFCNKSYDHARIKNHSELFEETVQKELTEHYAGKIVGISYQDAEDGNYYEYLKVGVIDLDMGVEKISQILKDLKAPKGTTLKQIHPVAVEYELDLKEKSELFFEESNLLLNSLVVESIRCSPTSWNEGKLTINFDGEMVLYKLKNKKSNKKAEISPALRQLCEDFCVLMWANDNQWREAEISFTRKNGEVNFKVNFNYDKPSASPAEEDKPWWKFW